MFFAAADPSWLESPQQAMAKVAEVAAAGRVTRQLRKAALSLDDITKSLSGLGSQIATTAKPYLEQARPYAEQAWNYAKERPEIALPVAGAGLGALLGGGSSLFSPKRRKNVLGNTLTGGLAGAGLGLGGAALAHGLPGLMNQVRGAPPAPAGTNPGPGTPAGASVSDPGATLQKLETSALPSVEKGVHTLGNAPVDFVKNHPYLSAAGGAHAGLLAHGALQNAARGIKEPLISGNETEFARGLDRAGLALGGGADDKTMGAAAKALAARLKAHGVKPESLEALHTHFAANPTNRRDLLLRALAGKTQPLPMSNPGKEVPRHIRLTPNQIGAISQAGRPLEGFSTALFGPSYGPQALERAGYRLQKPNVNPWTTAGGTAGTIGPETIHASPGIMNRLRRTMHHSRLPLIGGLGPKSRMALHASPYGAMLLGPALYRMYHEGAKQKAETQALLQQLTQGS